MNANFITGFIDGEASFIVMIKKQPAYKIGWKVEVKFTMGLHKKDKALLELIQSSLGAVGNITERKDSVMLIVSSFNDLAVLV